MYIKWGCSQDWTEGGKKLNSNPEQQTKPLLWGSSGKWQHTFIFLPLGKDFQNSSGHDVQKLHSNYINHYIQRALSICLKLTKVRKFRIKTVTPYLTHTFLASPYGMTDHPLLRDHCNSSFNVECLCSLSAKLDLEC